ncbi:MAG: amino acid dehydrogenase [Candidatus Helarchaeota archaeon]|nr:amino acid dehydrogenase [Candidatus Helarchaeota archaeon]
MDRKIFAVMNKNDLTSLEIFQNMKNGKFLLRGSKEWDSDIQFSRYNADFSYLDILTDNYKAVGTQQLIKYFTSFGLQDHLNAVEELIRNGGHEGIEFYYHKQKDIGVAFCKHSNNAGLQNRKHAIRAGAMRRHELNEPEIDVIRDGLNLSRAMTYKNACGGLPFGGCKTVIQCNPVKTDDLETIGFISYVADKTRCFPGADMGLDETMVDIIRSKYTKNYVGGTKSPLVTTGLPTAYGEYMAIKEACDFCYGSTDLSNKTIAIQGLGHVGFELVNYLVKENARLFITDIDLNKVKKVQQIHGTNSIQYVKPDEIYTVDADIFSPCAMGGIITEESIPKFKFKIIIGAANNQLKATSKKEELVLAKKLAEYGILFAVDWSHNTGGVIAAAFLWQRQDEATEKDLMPIIEATCKTKFRQVLNKSKLSGKTPTEIAYEEVENLLNRN